jgi:DNA replication ATP-dependent helicase Dna2
MSSSPITSLQTQLQTVKNNPKLSSHERLRAYFEIFNLIIEEATKDNYIHFTTLFSRLSYVASQRGLDRHFRSHCHLWRKGYEKKEITPDNTVLYLDLAYYTCHNLLYRLWELGEKVDLSEAAETYFITKEVKPVAFYAHKEVLVIEVDLALYQFKFVDEEEPDREKIAQWDMTDRNEIFNKNIGSLAKTFVLPIHANLIDVNVDEKGVYLPKALVIHPDHLLDVTSVAECFKDYGTEPILHMISRFKSSENSRALMVGNLVNLILDELISDPDVSFTSLYPIFFQSNPIGFALLSDDEARDLLGDLRVHYENLKKTITDALPHNKIDIDHIFLEPSFYSRNYGIQGRLDVLHVSPTQQIKTHDIIELKSGKVFRPNAYGINESHYIQTLMYDLMIQSSYGNVIRYNCILYSKEAHNNLRYAKPVKQKQYEILKVRNDLLAVEEKLKTVHLDPAIFRYIKPENFPNLKGFNRSDVEHFYQIYTTLDPLERSYFEHFTAFIAREQSLAKTGEHGLHRSNGHAALWLEDEEEKFERFAILNRLTIVQNETDQTEARIVFKKNTEDKRLANLRVGDIGVLYPESNEHRQAVLHTQIFKGSVVDLTPDTVTFKLRNKQYNQSLFLKQKYWAIEQDSLDSGFTSMYKSLFAWAAASDDYRRLMLGRRAPKSPIGSVDRSGFDSYMTEEQKDVLEAIIRSQDYFLLWGPPGTGKTSIMIKNLVKYLYHQTSEHILLLAYTNKAVDEICEAIVSIDTSFADRYLRLGTRIGAHPKFSSQLLEQRIKTLDNRQKIIQLISGHRIIVSTVSSIISRVDLMTLKTFDTVIIDEASQILEPMIVGFLQHFTKVVMIGDHKQLPAVVVQGAEESYVKNQKLWDHGIQDTRTSLFERLYIQATKAGWTHSYGIVGQQGRMHKELMHFVNMHFYQNSLTVLSSNPRQVASQFFYKSSHALTQHRKVFIPTINTSDSLNWKVNQSEAEITVQLLTRLIADYQLNDIQLTETSIGVITPYRAQIAQITELITQHPDLKAVHHLITIDTVERYQGGARDIIILSFCVSRLSQLDALVSTSLDGTDRKLNVALTRAKEHIYLIGNQEILSQNTTYASLISGYEKIEDISMRQ